MSVTKKMEKAMSFVRSVNFKTGDRDIYAKKILSIYDVQYF